MKGLDITGLNILFITHLHSDHTLGYPDIILTPRDHRVKPLEVYGPKGRLKAGTWVFTETVLRTKTGEEVPVSQRVFVVSGDAPFDLPWNY